MPAPPPQQQQQQASQFNPAARFNGAAHVRRPYESVYEKTYPAGASGTAAWIANRSHSVNGAGGAAKSRMAAKEVRCCVFVCSAVPEIFLGGRGEIRFFQCISLNRSWV